MTAQRAPGAAACSPVPVAEPASSVRIHGPVMPPSDPWMRRPTPFLSCKPKGNPPMERSEILSLLMATDADPGDTVHITFELGRTATKDTPYDPNAHELAVRLDDRTSLVLPGSVLAAARSIDVVRAVPPAMMMGECAAPTLRITTAEQTVRLAALATRLGCSIVEALDLRRWLEGDTDTTPSVIGGIGAGDARRTVSDVLAMVERLDGAAVPS